MFACILWLTKSTSRCPALCIVNSGSYWNLRSHQYIPQCIASTNMSLSIHFMLSFLPVTFTRFPDCVQFQGHHRLAGYLPAAEGVCWPQGWHLGPGHHPDPAQPCPWQPRPATFFILGGNSNIVTPLNAFMETFLARNVHFTFIRFAR